MPLNISFRFVTAARYAPGACIIRWAVFPHAHEAVDLRYNIFRSASPSGPWTEVEQVPIGATQFVDYDVFSPGTSRPYYYIVRVSSVAGAGYVDSSRALAAPQADNIAQEMIRKKLLFMLVKSGCPVGVLIRRTWGPNCNRCYNHQRQVASDANCPDCYGTGYTGGYLSPYYTPAILNLPKKAVIAAGIDYDIGQTYLELANVPIVGPDDIICDAVSNTRYAIREVTATAHRGATVSQICTINRLDEMSPVYGIPIASPGSVAYGRGWDLLGDTTFSRSLYESHALIS